MKEILNGIRKVLDNDKRKKLLWFLLIMLVGAGFETLSVTMVIPLIGVVLNPVMIEENDLIRRLCEQFNIRDHQAFVSFCIIALIIIYIVKNVYMFWEQRICNDFATECSIDLKNRLTEMFLHRRYDYYAEHDTNDMYQIIMGDSGAAIGIVQNLLSIMTEVVIALCLSLTILFINPVMTVWAVITLLLSVIVLIAFIRPRAQKIGKVYVEHSIERSKWVFQGLRGIKEIKVLHAEPFFLDNVKKEAGILRKLQKKRVTYSAIPRAFVETVCVCSMFGYMLFFVLTGEKLELLLPALGAFAMAAIKLMPAATRIAGAVSGINYAKKSLERVIAVIDEVVAEQDNIYGVLPAVDGMGDDSLCIRNVSFRYPSVERDVLRDASVTMPLGKVLCVIGESGAGKTTIADLILGLLTPSEGEIFICRKGGKDLKVGYIPQNSFLINDTIRRNVAFGIQEDEIDDTRVWSCLDAMGLSSYVRELPEGLDTCIGEGGIRMSGGQRQRIGIARAIYRECDFLILDEPTAALDKATEYIVLDTIRKMAAERTFLIIAHNRYTIEACDIVYEVADGKIQELGETVKW